MSLDDLSRTLDLKEGEFKILLEVAVTNAATIRALCELSLQQLSGGDTALLQKLKKEFEKEMDSQREWVTQHLYQRFGYLPGDISG
jgi:hypothetical protein